jgi:hypothetical protein
MEITIITRRVPKQENTVYTACYSDGVCIEFHVNPKGKMMYVIETGKGDTSGEKVELEALEGTEVYNRIKYRGIGCGLDFSKGITG